MVKSYWGKLHQISIDTNVSKACYRNAAYEDQEHFEIQAVHVIISSKNKLPQNKRLYLEFLVFCVLAILLFIRYFEMEIVEFETTLGNFSVELYKLHAPKTCFNFVELVKMGKVSFSACLL